MSATDAAAFAALHSCGKVVAATTWREEWGKRAHSRAIAESRAWEARGHEVVETTVGGVRAIGWCACDDKGYPKEHAS